MHARRLPVTSRMFLYAVALFGLALLPGTGRAEAPKTADSKSAADVTVIHTIKVDQLRDFMKAEGYAVSITEGKTSKYLAWKIDGMKTQMLIAEDAKSIQFHTAFSSSTTLARVNTWNRNKKFSRTYIDDDGDPHLELDLSLKGGITTEHLKEFIDVCRISFSVWIKEVVKAE
jgi:hypothetical protein